MIHNTVLAHNFQTINVLGLGLGLDTHLFVKVPQPGDSEVTFRSSSLAATCFYQFNHSLVLLLPV